MAVDGQGLCVGKDWGWSTLQQRPEQQGWEGRERKDVGEVPGEMDTGTAQAYNPAGEGLQP